MGDVADQAAKKVCAIGLDRERDCRGEKMKILYLLTNYGFPNSRAEKEIYSLGKKNEVDFWGWNRQLSYAGVRTTQIMIQDKSFSFSHVGIKAPIGEGFKRLFFPLIRFWIKEWRYLRKKIKEYDVIHVCDFDAAFPLLFMRRTVPVVYDIYDYYADTHQAPLFLDKMIRKIETRIINRADVTIICSEKREKQILPAKPRKLLVIHNTPSAAICPETCRKDQGGLYRIAYVGMLSEDRFLREISEVISNRKDCELHIGGIGVMEHYFEETSKKTDKIIYYGKMPYNEVLSLEHRCDIMTAIYDPRTPNHKYAAPNKFYEALMLKKPLIMMRDTGMDSYVEKYRFGEVIDGGAESFKEGFSRALDKLIAQKEQWPEMGERGYKLYREQFSWEEMERRLLSCYAELQKRQESKA